MFAIIASLGELSSKILTVMEVVDVEGTDEHMG